LKVYLTQEPRLPPISVLYTVLNLHVEAPPPKQRV